MNFISLSSGRKLGSGGSQCVPFRIQMLHGAARIDARGEKLETFDDHKAKNAHKSRCGRIGGLLSLLVRKLQLRSFIPFVIIIVYTIIGAVIFMSLEKQAQVDRKDSMRSELLKEYHNALYLLLATYNEPAKQTIQDVQSNYSWVLNNFQTMALEKKFNEFEWDYWNALLFAGSIYTTIGYGNIACVTVGGRVMTIFYALFGIPMMLATMSQFGGLLIDMIDYVSESIVRPVATKVKQLTKGKTTSTTAINKAVEEEPDDNNMNRKTDKDPLLSLGQQNEAPVLGSIIATVTWILGCAGIFTLWETQWTYFESFYFFFVSLSTIGFGDMVPQHPKYMVANFLLVIVGLSMVTMCINVVQDKLENIYLAILKHMLQEYQKAIAAGEDAQEGMMSQWNNNRAAKWLLPLMSSGKAQTAMHKLKEEAKAQGIELPDALANIDMNTGRPALFNPEKQSHMTTTADPPKPIVAPVVVKPVMFDKIAQTDPLPKPKTPPPIRMPTPTPLPRPQPKPKVMSHAMSQTVPSGTPGRNVAVQVKQAGRQDAYSSNTDLYTYVDVCLQTDGSFLMPEGTRSIGIQETRDEDVFPIS